MPRKANENIGECPCINCGRMAHVRREKNKGLFYLICPPAGEYEGCGKVTANGKAGQISLMESAHIFGAPEPENSIIDEDLTAQEPAQVPEPAPVPEPEPAQAPKPIEPKQDAPSTVPEKSRSLLDVAIEMVVGD